MSLALNVAAVESLRSTLHTFRRLLTHEAADMRRQVVTELRHLFKADSGALFYQPSERKGFVRLMASEPNTPTATLDLKISTESGAGLTGFLATLDDVEMFDFNALRNHPSRANHSPSHLAGGKCCSILAIPLRDERGFLIALLKLENKLGPNGRAAEELSFTEEDKLMARLISGPVATLVESSIRRSALLDLSRNQAASSHGEKDCLEALRACVSLLYADRAELAYWNEAAEALVMVKHFGAESPELKEGQLIPREGVIYDQWSLRNSFFIVPKEKLVGDNSTALHPASRSQIVFLCHAGGIPKAILNIESSEENWFRESHRPLLELLESFIIQATRKLETQNDRVELAEWPPCLPGFGWFRIFRRFDRDDTHKPHERLHWSMSPSCVEMFGLPPSATSEEYLRWMEAKPGQALDAAITKSVLEESTEIEQLSRTEFKIYPESRPPRIVKFFGMKSGFGEVQCILLDVTAERMDAEKHLNKDWKTEILPWLRVGFSEGNGKYVQVTRATARMYGYKDEDEFNKEVQNAHDVYFDRNRRKALMDQLEKTTFVENFEFAARKAGETGSTRPSTFISQDVLCTRRGNDRNDWKLLALFHDISDRKAMERKLCMAGVAGALLHDAGGPFQRIENHRDTLSILIKKCNYEQCSELLLKIKEECSQGYSDTRHWLEIAKGKPDPKLKSQLLMANLKAFAARANVELARLQVTVDDPPDDCCITYNAELLGFAFHQLFKNVRAKVDGQLRRCTVRANFENPPAVEITVDDEGPGFGADLGRGWKAIAELDKRLNKDKEETAKGGLGLVMCNAVVELCHGEMSLSDWSHPDESPGGARVKLTFTADQKPANSPETSA